MMRFLADMGVSIRVVEWLRSNGHDAKHLREEGLHRMPNGEIFTKAFHENRIIITFDLDFGEIVALSKGEKTSVILEPVSSNTGVQEPCASLRLAGGMSLMLSSFARLAVLLLV